MDTTARPIVLWLMVVTLLTHRANAGPWQDGVKPARVVTLDSDKVFSFFGNTTHDDHFKEVLPVSHSYILVGGRNVVYNLSTDDLSELTRFEWHPDTMPKQSCYLKGGSEEICENFIRVLTGKNNDREFIICGTYAYRPTCADFTVNNGVLERQREFEGRGLCPYDYRHNSTHVYVDDNLYVGTVADFSGLDPLIYRAPLRTKSYDLSILNEPNFVKSIALGDYIYFFFRERAEEYKNCGKALFSRVARVCRFDKGGPHKFKNRWTSFLKSRLNCSVGGDYPFYFNELQAIIGPLEGRYGGEAQTLIYGIFTTPENSISGSAVCAFSFQHILDIFEGPFKVQESPDANWLPLKESKVPEPRPGQCVQDSRTLPDETLNFTQANSLMDDAVPAYFNQPILINTNTHSSGRFTSIEVDPQVRTPDGKAYDVFFIGTDNGKILKAINIKSHDSNQNVEPFIIEELEVAAPGTAIISLQIIRPFHKEPRLLITLSDQIQSIPLWRCYSDRITSCGDCIALRDPHCAWDKTTQRCRAMRQSADDAIQSVASGTHSECSSEPEDADMIFDDNEISVNLYEKVHLNCGIKGEYRYCVWEKGSDSYQVEDVRSGVYSSMSRPDELENNQCGIVLNQAMVEDQGNWRCKIYFPRGKVLTGTKNVVIAGTRSPLYAP